MMHTENGIKHHKALTGCEGTMTPRVVDKGELGSFEFYYCDGTHKKGRGAGKPCTYVGRGKRLTEDDLAKIAAKAEPKIDTEIEGIVFEEDDELPDA